MYHFPPARAMSADVLLFAISAVIRQGARLGVATGKM
jgi:hypothetical protein